MERAVAWPLCLCGVCVIEVVPELGNDMNGVDATSCVSVGACSGPDLLHDAKVMWYTWYSA